MYIIANWDDIFENSESRKYQTIKWLPLPNKLDGKGLARIRNLGSPEGEKVFTAWVLMLQLSSKMKTRGLLVDNDGPLTTEDMALKTGFSEEIFKLAIPVLIKNGWIKEKSEKVRKSSE